METITPGMIGESEATVTDNLTARAMGSGSLDVYATPAMIALMEAAAVAALASALPEGQTSVGVALDVAHLAATPLGGSARARAQVTGVEGRRVTFSVQAWDAKQLIGEGSHTRVVVDVRRFMSRLS